MQDISRVEKLFLSRLRELPPDKQQEALDFVEFLRTRAVRIRSRDSLRGLWADLNVEISAEDVAAARREMWGEFPRDIS